MLQKTDAILLRKQDLRETSLFLTFYTRGFGKILGVMKGVRGQKGQYTTAPQLFSLNEIVFYERKTKEIFTISQCELKEFFAEIREDLEKTTYASYFIELVNSLVPAGERNEPMFELLENSLRLLSNPGSAKRIARVFEIKLLDLLGLMPRLDSCVVCSCVSLAKRTYFSFKEGGVLCERCSSKEKDAVTISAGVVSFIERINRAGWDLVPRIKVSSQVGHEVERLLTRFFYYHLHLRPKAVEFMRSIQI